AAAGLLHALSQSSGSKLAVRQPRHLDAFQRFGPLHARFMVRAVKRRTGQTGVLEEVEVGAALQRVLQSRNFPLAPQPGTVVARKLQRTPVLGVRDGEP